MTEMLRGERCSTEGWMSAKLKDASLDLVLALEASCLLCENKLILIRGVIRRSEFGI